MLKNVILAISWKSVKNDGLASVFFDFGDSGYFLRNAILGYRTLFRRTRIDRSSLVRSPACNSVSRRCTSEAAQLGFIAHLELPPYEALVLLEVIIYWVQEAPGAVWPRLPEGS